MKNARYWVFGAAFIAVLVLFSAQSARSVYSSPVLVTNTPLPVVHQGPLETSIGNTPTVNLASGTTVGLSGNDPAHPLLVRDVDTRSPYTASCELYENMFGANCNIQVPAGSRFVIKQVSIDVYFSSGKLSYAEIVTSTGGNLSVLMLPATDLGMAKGAAWSISTAHATTEIFADGGTWMQLSIHPLPDAVLMAGSHAYLSGYLVAQ